jgi:hypothetical protein
VTDEYIELCRELALPLPDGRLCEWTWADGDNNSVFTLRLDEYDDTIGGPDEPGDGVWLPREGDWLALLEAEEITWVDIQWGIDEFGPSGVVRAVTGVGAAHRAHGPDLLTALARLYKAVRESERGPADDVD